MKMQLSYVFISVNTFSASGLHVPSFQLKAETYGESICIKSECGKIWTRKTPDFGTFHKLAVRKWDHTDQTKSSYRMYLVL